MSPVLFAVILSGLQPSAVAEPADATLRHCQVPCGIYSDLVRIDLLL